MTFKGDVPLEYAEEMVAVGAVVSDSLVPPTVGELFSLAGHPAVITGEITQEQFLERVEMAGMRRQKFLVALPAGARFFTFSTD